MSNWVNCSKAIRDLSILKKQLTGRQIAIAINTGINRTLLEGRTTARTAVKAEYNIPQRYLNGINVRKSRVEQLTGHIYASAVPIPMDAFGPRFTNVSSRITVSRRGAQKVTARKSRKQPGQGVSIEVHKGKREIVPYAFMIAGAKPRVFARGAYRASFGFERRFKRLNASGSDTPIKPLISVSVHGAVINPIAMKAITKRIEDEHHKNIEQQLKFQVMKAQRDAQGSVDMGLQAG